MRKLIPILLIALTSTAFAQGDAQDKTETGQTTVAADVDVNTDGLVSIASKGKSVRDVLFDLFVEKLQSAFVLRTSKNVQQFFLQ